MKTENFISWFSEYYSEIFNIFNYYPNTKIPREFKLNINTYYKELISEIYLKLKNQQIQNNKSEILFAVEEFADRKRRYRKSARKFRWS